MLFFTINLHFVTSIQKPTYRKTNLALTNRSHLVFVALETQERLKQTKVYHTFFTFSEKKPIKNLQKWQQQNPFSPVCMLLVQLVSMNVSYTM